MLDSSTVRAGAGGGTWCGPYRLLGELGRGGSGVVWRAWDARHQREVALKVLTSGSAEARERFAREAQALQRLQHPGLVPLLDSGVWEDRPYLVMTLVRGRPLVDATRSGELDVREAARVVRDAAQAVAHAHARGVLHRDLKPHNLLVDQQGQVKVLDFGVARLADAEGLTRTGHVVGSVAFMPPEQLDSRRGPVDARSDVWALGATLYAALCGASPFSGAPALVEAILSQPAAPPSTRRRGVPPALDAIALRCLEKDPRRRYAGAGELADDLHRFLNGARPLALAAPSRARAGALALLLVSVGGAALTALALGRPGEPERATPHQAAAVDTAGPAVAAILSRAALVPAAGEAQDAPFVRELLALGPDARPALVACVEAAAARFEAAADQLIFSVARPAPEEEAAGWDELRGLTEALARERARDPTTSQPPDVGDLLSAAQQRLVARTIGPAQEWEEQGPPPPRLNASQLLVRAQSSVDPGLWRAARVATAALALTRPPTHAQRQALWHLLSSDEDEERAVGTALALLELLGPEDHTWLERLEVVGRRCPQGGPWHARVEPRLAPLLDALPAQPTAEQLVRRGMRRMRRGDRQGAWEDQEQALKLDPDAWEAYSLRATLGMLLDGDVRTALEDADRAVALRPEAAWLWGNRGVLRYRSGDLPGALDDLARALQRGHDSPAYVHLQMGLVQEAGEDLAAAEASFRRAVELRPRFAAPWRRLGELLEKRGASEEAEQAWTRVIANEPLRAAAFQARSRLRLRLGRAAEALADAERGVALEPEGAGMWLQLGVARDALGDKAGMQQAVRRALQLSPQNESTQRALEALGPEGE